jgi:hypothetical protein
MIAMPELVPSRVAPASIIASAVGSSRTPPEALTPISAPTVRRRAIHTTVEFIPAFATLLLKPELSF